MEQQVQQFVTLHFGDLWLDVPIGPLATSLSKSTRTTTASSIEPEQEKEVSPARKDGTVPVMLKSAKRRMRAAAKASKGASLDQHKSVHKAASYESIPGFANFKLIIQKAAMSFQGTTLHEWPILAKRVETLKFTATICILTCHS